MAKDTYSSGGSAYPITVYPAPADGKKRSVIPLVHGKFGLGSPYGEQIQSFARDLAGLGYLTAVPQYYLDGKPQPTDTVPKVRDSPMRSLPSPAAPTLRPIRLA
jgi:dienelactone hydrolase